MRQNNSNTSADITGRNLDSKIAKFDDVINGEKTIRVPLRHFCNLGKTDYPVKINFKITCTLETKIKELFETKKNPGTVGSPDAKSIFTNAPYIQFE